MHPTQLKILKKLYFSDGLRYTNAKPSRLMENNEYSFHLNQLIKSGYVNKISDYYHLTNAGKEFTGRVDIDNLELGTQSKITISVCCTRKTGNNQQFLIHTRLRQPFYGCQSFLSGKLQFGNKITQSAEEELTKRAGLKGKAQIISIKHYLVTDKESKELLEDLFLFLCHIRNPKGKLKKYRGGKFKWINEKELNKYVTNHIENEKDFRSQIDEINKFNGNVTIEEVVHESSKY